MTRRGGGGEQPPTTPCLNGTVAPHVPAPLCEFSFLASSRASERGPAANCSLSNQRQLGVTLLGGLGTAEGPVPV